MRKVIVIGAGGHAKVVVDILKLMKGVKIHGLLDADQKLRGQKILGITILGDDSVLPSLAREGIRYAFIGVGAGGNPGAADLRRQLFEKCLGLGLKMISAVHPKAVIASSAVLSEGVAVMAGALINPGASIGANSIVNTGAIVEHDCVIEEHAHIATGAHLAGCVRVGASAHIGIGATVRQGIVIGPRAVVGAGAVVTKDVMPGAIVIGNPASPLKKAVTHTI